MNANTTPSAATEGLPVRGAGWTSVVQGLLIFVPTFVLGAAVDWPASLDDYADVGALVLVVVLLVMAVKMHNFWSKTDEHAQGAFWKNVSMAGAAFFFFALVANGGDFGPVLSDDLLSLFSNK